MSTISAAPTTYGGKHTELFRLRQQVTQLQEEKGDLQDENEELKLERDRLRVVNQGLEALLNNSAETRMEARGTQKTNGVRSPSRDSSLDPPPLKRPRLKGTVPENTSHQTQTAESSSGPSKRGRGRPRKNPLPESLQPTDGEASVKRGRGRPRKSPLLPSSQSPGGETSVKRGRGRPRKIPQPTIEIVEKRGRGRPRKNPPPSSTQSSQGSKTAPSHSEDARKSQESQSRFFVGDTYPGTLSTRPESKSEKVSGHAYVGAMPPRKAE